jgi:hypothetical protein
MFPPMRKTQELEKGHSFLIIALEESFVKETVVFLKRILWPHKSIHFSSDLFL